VSTGRQVSERQASAHDDNAPTTPMRRSVADFALAQGAAAERLIERAKAYSCP
jgi:hypothetical protein